MKRLLYAAVILSAVCLFMPSQSKAQAWACNEKTGCVWHPPAGCRGGECAPPALSQASNIMEEAFDAADDTMYYLMFGWWEDSPDWSLDWAWYGNAIDYPNDYAGGSEGIYPD